MIINLFKCFIFPRHYSSCKIRCLYCRRSS